MNRRDFLKRGAAAAAVSPLLLNTRIDSRSSMPNMLLYKISLAEWSLVQLIRAGELDHLDFPRVAREHDIDGLEYVNQFFMDKATDTAYLQEMKNRADGEGAHSLILMCDNEGQLGDPDPAARMQAVENHHKWVDAAAFLNCHSVRVNAYSEGTWEEEAGYAADGLRKLTEYAAERNLNVIVENHGGFSSDAEWLLEVIRQVDHHRFGMLPDFGNFRIAEGKSYDSYEGVRKLTPYAFGMSAKGTVWDMHGNQSPIDLRRMMQIVLDNGYRGYVGIEYGGLDGIRTANAELRKIRDELSAT